MPVLALFSAPVAAIAFIGLVAGWGMALGLFFVWLALSAPAALLVLAILVVGGRNDRECD